MVPPPKNPSKSDEETTKRLDRQVLDMVAALADKLRKLNTPEAQPPPSPEVEVADDDEHGIRVLTLAGTNTGATMRADLSHKLSGNMEVPAAYANSNCQAVNNSIMMNAKYTSEDPGVHMIISEYSEEEDGKRKEKKKKDHKKEKHVEKSDGGKASEGEE